MYANTTFLLGMWERAVREYIGVQGSIVGIKGFRMSSFNVVGQTVTVQGPRRGSGGRTDHWAWSIWRCGRSTMTACRSARGPSRCHYRGGDEWRSTGAHRRSRDHRDGQDLREDGDPRSPPTPSRWRLTDAGADESRRGRSADPHPPASTEMTPMLPIEPGIHGPHAHQCDDRVRFHVRWPCCTTAAAAIEAGQANVVVLVYADAPLQPGGVAGAAYAAARASTGMDGLLTPRQVRRRSRVRAGGAAPHGPVRHDE